jgi:hypothetical protein
MVSGCDILWAGVGSSVWSERISAVFSLIPREFSDFQPFPAPFSSSLA